MRLRETIVLVLVLSLAIVPIVSQDQVRSQTQGQYSERIDVYSAGGVAYTDITLSQFNVTSSGLAAAEASSGLNGYRLVALSTQNFESDYQIFGPDGYNVLNVPYLPTEGVFLMVNATSASDAASLVSYFDTALGMNLTLTSSGSGSYTYSGVVDFTGVALPVLYKLVPASYKGFSSIFSESTLLGLPLPSISVVGVKDGSSFENSVVLGAASNSVINTDGSLNFLKVLGGTNSTVETSTNSTSSEVVVHSLDGLIYSTDANATVVRNTASFSSTYSLTVPSGHDVKPNMTLYNGTPTLNAYRSVILTGNPGGQVLSVTLWLANTAESSSTQSMTIENVTVNDNWWQKDPSVFELQTGANSSNVYNMTVAQILPTENTSLVYHLDVISSSPSEVVIPATSVTYTYTIGTQTFTKEATLNEVDLQLNGNAEPGMNIIAQPESPYLSGSSVGSNATYLITLVNGGSAPATGVKVAGQTISNIPADSTYSTPIKVPITVNSLIQRNFSQTFTLTWSTPTLQTESITSNSVALVLSHSAMAIPDVEVTTTAASTATSIAHGEMNVTYALANEGSSNTGTVTAVQTLPSGVACSVLNNGTATVTCNGNQATIRFSTIAALKTDTVILALSFSKNDYIVPPLNVSSTYQQTTLHSYGEGFGIAGGLVATKVFSPGIVFPGMKSVVTVGFTNSGSQTLYNVTLSSSQDAFDSISASTLAQKTFASIAPDQSVSFSYNVTVSKESSGNLTAEQVESSFLMAGASQSLTLGQSNLLVYKPLSLSAASSSSSPETGKDFSVTFTITNGAPVAVSDVNFNWTLPSGVSLVSGAHSSGKLVTQSFSSVGANSTQSFTLTLTSNIGLTVDTTSSHLSYQYQGTTLAGSISSVQVTVKEDLTTGYAIPIVLAILIALAVVIYVRRISSPAKA